MKSREIMDEVVPGEMVVQDQPLSVTGVCKLPPAAKPNAGHEFFQAGRGFGTLSCYDYFSTRVHSASVPIL